MGQGSSNQRKNSQACTSQCMASSYLQKTLGPLQVSLHCCHTEHKEQSFQEGLIITIVNQLLSPSNANHIQKLQDLSKGFFTIKQALICKTVFAHKTLANQQLRYKKPDNKTAKILWIHPHQHHIYLSIIHIYSILPSSQFFVSS